MLRRIKEPLLSPGIHLAELKARKYKNHILTKQKPLLLYNQITDYWKFLLLKKLSLEIWVCNFHFWVLRNFSLKNYALQKKNTMNQTGFWHHIYLQLFQHWQHFHELKTLIQLIFPISRKFCSKIKVPVKYQSSGL